MHRFHGQRAITGFIATLLYAASFSASGGQVEGRRYVDRKAVDRPGEEGRRPRSEKERALEEEVRKLDEKIKTLGDRKVDKDLKADEKRSSEENISKPDEIGNKNDLTEPERSNIHDIDTLSREISTDEKKSPEIHPDDVRNKSADEIRQLAEKLGLERKADKDIWLDPITGKERMRIDDGHVDPNTGKPYDDANAAVPHVHIYPAEGRRYGGIADPVTGNEHIPIKSRD